MAVNGTGGHRPPGRLDWWVVRRAALVAIVVTVPVAVLAGILGNDDTDGEGGSLWPVAVVAMFAGFALAGNLAARRRPDAPLVHAAAAAGVAFGLLTAATVLRRVITGEGLTAPLIITLGLLLQITVSLAMVGAYVGMRHRARRQARPGP